MGTRAIRLPEWLDPRQPPVYARQRRTGAMRSWARLTFLNPYRGDESMMLFRRGVRFLTRTMAVALVLLAASWIAAPTDGQAKLPPPVFQPPIDRDGGGDEWPTLTEPGPGGFVSITSSDLTVPDVVGGPSELAGDKHEAPSGIKRILAFRWILWSCDSMRVSLGRQTLGSSGFTLMAEYMR